MHGRAWLLGDGFCHECGKAIMLKSCLPDQTFKIENLIGKFDWVAVP